MKKLFGILGAMLLTIIAFEVFGIFSSKIMVSDLCKHNEIPVVYSKNEWNDWKMSIRTAAPEGVDNEVQRKLLEQLAHERKMSTKSYAGYPYNYPYSGVWAFRNEIWIKGKKVASVAFYQSQTEMGPIQRYIFGGNIGSIYSCINDRKFYQKFLDLMGHEFVSVGDIDRHDYGWKW